MKKNVLHLLSQRLVFLRNAQAVPCHVEQYFLPGILQTSKARFSGNVSVTSKISMFLFILVMPVRNVYILKIAV